MAFKRSETKTVHSPGAVNKLWKALHERGLLPENCTRFVIESEVGGVIRITADYYAPESIQQAAEEIAAALTESKA
jgi:hypothetical protein